MDFVNTKIDGVMLLKLPRYADERGYFFESFVSPRYNTVGVDDVFMQDNLSMSYKNILRGMHFQHTNPQSQLVTVLDGSIFDVCVDVRPGSNSFGSWVGFDLSSDGYNQIYMAPGIAHGYVALSERAVLHYKCSKVYDPNTECGLLWNDPAVGIEWPVDSPILCDRDLNFQTLQALCENQWLPKL